MHILNLHSSRGQSTPSISKFSQDKGKPIPNHDFYVTMKYSIQAELSVEDFLRPEDPRVMAEGLV